MAKAYRFELVPESTKRYVEFLIVGDENEADINEAIEDDADEFFGELIGDRYPGYALDDWYEVDPEEAKNNNPFRI